MHLTLASMLLQPAPLLQRPLHVQMMSEEALIDDKPLTGPARVKRVRHQRVCSFTK